MRKTSRYPFTETLARLSQAIVDAHNTIFATIDQSAAAREAGLTLRPTTLVIFGNPKGGTPLMEAFPLAALDLPLKFLVWEENGGVNVAYTTAAEIAKRYGVTGKDALIQAMDHALETLAGSIAQVSS
jgi:uncharacterized protein (DUF302 family)